ncbi:prepilin peptidase-dependent protein [Orbaceae bacterium ESL0721]|nr:prepilin peptidase-dependent protein [Orbaceae bacterium ESL0721]
MLIESNIEIDKKRYKAGGYSLFEMLISITLSASLIIAITSLYPQLQIETIHHYQQYRLEQSIQNAMAGVTKDLKRAGFIANDPTKISEKAVELNSRGDCITIRYDSEIRGKWVYHPTTKQNSDIFSYRYKKDSVEYKTDTVDCNGGNWEKLLDPKEIKVTHFAIKLNHNYSEIILHAELKKNSAINYQYRNIVKNENH